MNTYPLSVENPVIAFMRYISRHVDIHAVRKLIEKTVGVLIGGYNKEVVFKIPDGRVFKADLQYTRNLRLFLGRYYETHKSKLIRVAVKRGDTVFDIGANIGLYTTLLSQVVGMTGKVHVFETSSDTFKFLRTNCELNNTRNVVLNNTAVIDKDGEVNMCRIDENLRVRTSITARGRKDFAKITNRAVSLDTYVNENSIKKVEFVSLDAEGSELLVLKGFSLSFAFNPPPIWNIELSPRTEKYCGYSQEDVLEFLSSKGYELYFLDRWHNGGGLRRFKKLDDYPPLRNFGSWHVVAAMPQYHMERIKSLII